MIYGIFSRELDPGLEEPIATLIWATPRLQADVVELKNVSKVMVVSLEVGHHQQHEKSGLKLSVLTIYHIDIKFRTIDINSNCSV
jgi:hypothetical protein